MEKTRVFDLLIMKHNVRYVDITRAIAEHDIDNDNDIQEIKNMFLGEREKIEK